MIEKKHRIEDALEAVRSAQEEGIVPGGGVPLIRATQATDFEVDNEDQALGVEIIRKAVFAPLRQMAENAGESPDIIQTIVGSLEDNQGYDFVTEPPATCLRVGHRPSEGHAMRPSERCFSSRNINHNKSRNHSVVTQSATSYRYGTDGLSSARNSSRQNGSPQ